MSFFDFRHSPRPLIVYIEKKALCSTFHRKTYRLLRARVMTNYRLSSNYPSYKILIVNLIMEEYAPKHISGKREG